MLPGCLIDDPPPYTQPKRTPPRLVYHQAAPELGRVIVARAPDLIPFKIPVASEDAGEALTALLYLNQNVAGFSRIASSTIDDTTRAVLFNYRVVDGFRSGCYRFTIRVGHESNLPDDRTPPGDENDLAEAYWLAFLNPPEGDNDLPTDDCPDMGLGGQP